MTKNPDCIFCKIVKKEISAEIIYEDDSLISFLDINPVNKGHILLIPKEHYRWMTDLPDTLLSKIYTKSKYLMEKIKTALKADFVVLSVVGIDVPHFHVHLLPRYNDDGLANFWPTKKYENDELKKYGDILRATLK